MIEWASRPSPFSLIPVSMLMPPSVTLDKLPQEILEEILAELEYDKVTLNNLGLTCHALCTGTRSHRFPAITLHDQNFVAFMKLTYLTPWNTIVPSIRRLRLGNRMFSLSHCQSRDWCDSLLSPNLDFTGWAAQFGYLSTLDLRDAAWSRLPSCFTIAICSLRVDHLVVLIKNTLEFETLTNTILPTMRPKTLTMSGPSWANTSLPLPPSNPVGTGPCCIHYMQLDRNTKEFQRHLIDWLRNANTPTSITYLYIEMFKGMEELALAELLPLMSPIHLRLKLPSDKTVLTDFEFPVAGLSDLQTLQISSIYNDLTLAHAHVQQFFEVDEHVSPDILVVSRLLKQFSVLQNHLRHIQLDSICPHTNLIFGDIPEIFSTSYPLLNSLSLTVKRGRRTDRDSLAAWLTNGPFAMLQSRGVKLKIKAAAPDPMLSLP
ncbi:hypothetical protein NP233_g5414 [Leucocoprinus birnbaumii]|uniref:F-box domain-containing protein n=1 Tax=Leucocoprinus birnbaumii TaxID=56174 RepID=A0AAD5VZ78_9AGAR|nr:hypothetical protein NP233_g5414 [Leucocoprinus birnbaumii]